MSKKWPNEWRDALSNILGEDFFSGFENMDVSTSRGDQTSATMNTIEADIYESDDDLLCVFALPGLTLSDIDIYVFRQTVEVKGQIHIYNKGFRLRHQELYHGPVIRTLKLPFPVRDDKVDAAFKKGLLYVHLQRLESPSQSSNEVHVRDLDKE